MIKNFDFEGEIGFYLVVDLEYPKELFEDHINYPLAPNKMKITYDLLSEYQKNLIDKNLINFLTQLYQKMRNFF